MQLSIDAIVLACGLHATSAARSPGLAALGVTKSHDFVQSCPPPGPTTGNVTL